jgi:hypothetical protein
VPALFPVAQKSDKSETRIYQDLSIRHYMVEFEGRGGYRADCGWVQYLGRRVRMGGFGVGFLLPYHQGYRIVPCFPHLSDWFLLVHFYAHLLII